MAKVKHIVLLKFKDGTNDEQTSKFFDDLLDLSESIAGIDDYVSGFNNSAEGKALGLTHGFIMTFSDVTARDAYLVHPEHERFKTMAMVLVETALIFDFASIRSCTIFAGSTFCSSEYCELTACPKASGFAPCKD